MADARFHYLVTFGGEITIKSRRTRRRFTDRLATNLKDSLDAHGAPYALRQEWSRIFVESDDPDLATAIGRVFGVKAVARAERRAWRDLDHLVDLGEEIFGDVVTGKTFAVRARRGGDASRIPFRSPDLERALGSRLFDRSAGVDLERPEVEVRVELHGPKEAFFFRHRQVWHGGLPVGTEGRALALMSGGFDSAVAAWQILRRGVRLDYVFFNLGGDLHRDAVLRVAKVLADTVSWGYRPRLHLVDLRPAVDELKAKTPSPLWQVILKRQMLRAASGVAATCRAQGLVTGEAIGQVSSQTLVNLGTIERAIRLPVLRPLIATDKDEIFDLARAIGTYELSAGVPEFCGLDGTTGPATHARTPQVEEAEAILDMDSLHRLIRQRAVLDLRAFDPDAASTPDLAVDPAVDGVDDGTHWIDLRSQGAHEAWHPPDCVHLSYPDALTSFQELDRSVPWVAFCEVGLKSAHLAEVMAAAGYRARHAQGGMRKVMRWAEETFDPALRALLSPALLD